MTTNDNTSGKSFQTSKVLTIALAHLLHDIFSIFLTPLLPFLKEKHSLSNSQIGYLSSSQRLASFLSPVIGILSERLGLKWIVIITPALTSICMSLLGAAPNYLSLLLLLSLMGLSSAFFHVPSPVLIRSVAGDKVGLAMSLYMMSGQAARALGPIVAVAGVVWLGLDKLWLLMFLGIGNSIVLFFMIHRTDYHLQIKKKEEHESIREVFKQFRFLFLCIGIIILGQSLMKTAVTNFLPIYLTDLGFTKTMAGSVTCLVQIAGVLGSLCCGILSDKVCSRKILWGIGLAGPTVLLLFCQVTSFWALIGLIFVLGFTILSSNAVFMSMVNRIKSSQSAFINGIYMSLNFGIAIFAIILTGYLGDVMPLKTTYQIAAGVAFVTLPMINFLPRLDEQADS